VPAAKKKTRWEEYAQQKGIRKRKKGRMVYDETAKDWLIEVPDQAGKSISVTA
jgi:regulator of ribosome biosynthesis